MTCRDLLQLAWQAVWFHRQRSLLTMLGILIGVASVILLTSIGEGCPRLCHSAEAAGR
jgi:putative ABC transport system permease protein